MHYEGDEPCGETCNGPHIDHTPAGFTCPNCGSAASRCFPTCREVDLYRPFEPYEGLTGEQEHAANS